MKTEKVLQLYDHNIWMPFYAMAIRGAKISQAKLNMTKAILSANDNWENICGVINSVLAFKDEIIEHLGQNKVVNFITHPEEAIYVDIFQKCRDNAELSEEEQFEMFETLMVEALGDHA